MWLHCGQFAGNKNLENQRQMTQNSTIDHADKMWCKKKDNNRKKRTQNC